LYGDHRTVAFLISQPGASPVGYLQVKTVKLVSMTAQADGGGPEVSDGRPAGSDGQPEGSTAGQGQAATPLQRLIQQRLHERKWSYGEVARRGGLPRSTVYTLATTRNLVRPPRPATIDALARGLDVPVSLVRSAAAESTGLHYYDEAPPGPHRPGDQERDLLIASIDELSPEDRRHVAALVESLRRKPSPEPTDG
jgi:transcriptional regulator with XRE-family HTH domain